MTIIRVDEQEVKNMESKLQTLAQTIAQISTNTYVSKNVFSESQGQSVDSLNAILDSVMGCAKQMEIMFFNTCRYLDQILEQFQFVEENYQDLFYKVKE